MAMYYKIKAEAAGHMVMAGSWCNGRQLVENELFTPSESEKCGLASFPDLYTVIEFSKKQVVYVSYIDHRRNGLPVFAEHRYMPVDCPNGSKHDPKQPETLARYLGRKLLPKY